MTYRFDGYNYVVALQKGELLAQSLDRLARELQLKSAWLNGLGSAQWAEIGFYDLQNKQYKWQKKDELLEIISLQGNLAWRDGAPVWHIHGTFSDQNMQAFGGHVKELSVGGACELLLHTIQGEAMHRQHDDKVGLKLLQL